MKGKNIFKCLAIVATLIVMIIAVSGCTGSKEVVWKVGHVRPQGTSTDTDLVEFTKNVASSTNDEIKIEVFPASQLGNYDVVQERVGLGDIDMQLAPAANSVTKALSVSSAPYLVTTWDEARDMFAWGGPMMNAIEEMLGREGIKVLAQYPKYFGGIALAKEPKMATDPYTNQELKIRVPGIKSYELTATALGYLATPIPFSEAFTAMQTGIVDGVIGSGAEGYWSSFRDLTKYFLPLNDHFEMWFLYINEKTFSKLSEENREKLMAAAKEMEDARWSAAPLETDMYIQNLKSQGTTIIPFTNADLNRIAQKVREEVWPEIIGEYGVELFKELTKGM